MKLDCLGMDTVRNENSDGENLCFFQETHGKFVGNSFLPLTKRDVEGEWGRFALAGMMNISTN